MIAYARSVQEIGLEFDVIGEPDLRTLRDSDVSASERELEKLLSVIGTACVFLFVSIVIFVALSIYFVSPLPVVGIVVSSCLIAGLLRVGETLFAKRARQALRGVTRDGLG